MTFEILDDGIKKIAKDAFDSLLQPFAEGGLAKKCKIVYPPKMSLCNNCEPSPIGNKSSNKYLHGGPIPFPIGSICPACGGNGYIAQEASEDMYFTTKIIEKPYFQLGIDVNVPDGLLRIKGFIRDLPKLKRADYILHDIDMSGYLNRKYKMYGEPTSKSNIVQGEYFEAYFIRVQ